MLRALSGIEGHLCAAEKAVRLLRGHGFASQCALPASMGEDAMHRGGQPPLAGFLAHGGSFQGPIDTLREKWNADCGRKRGSPGLLPRHTDEDGREVWGPWALSIAGTSHAGRVRMTNEDAFDRFDDPARGEILLVVADGLGGHRSGEVASTVVVGTLGEMGRVDGTAAAARLTAAIERANREIFERAATLSRLKGMGTTVVALLLSAQGPAFVAHVGDSRLYRLRDGSLAALTEDHSLAAQLLRNGEITEEEARVHPRRNVLIRAVGVQRRVEVEVAPVEISASDTFLLCSDGIYEMLRDAEIQEILNRAPDAHAAAAWLVDAANQNGGKDNATALVVQVSSAP